MRTHPFGVIVIDDDNADVETIAHGLQSLASPPQIVVFRTASEALHALHTQQELANPSIPFLILVERNLPLVTGLELLACIRCDASLRHVPVFVLGDSCLEADKAAALQLGAAGYLRKPTVAGGAHSMAALLETYVRSGNYPARLSRATHRRAQSACMPRSVAGASKLPAWQRGSLRGPTLDTRGIRNSDDRGFANDRRGTRSGGKTSPNASIGASPDLVPAQTRRTSRHPTPFGPACVARPTPLCCPQLGGASLARLPRPQPPESRHPPTYARSLDGPAPLWHNCARIDRTTAAAPPATRLEYLPHD